ncbi:hypothetical protein ACIRPQ_29270 [Streptomyces sp. NPDC101213]|uniref:hypothetical protein n=1 Tax=Streptomyces sp. NPDC101213 TaxID=3366130 RepID=UPI0037FBA0EE
MHSQELNDAGVTEEVMAAAVRAMFDDLKPLAEKEGLPVREVFASFSPEIESAYVFGYTVAVLSKKTGTDLSRHAATAILYAMGQSRDPAVREHAADLRLKLAATAYRQINDEMRAAGEDPSFRPVACSQCPVPRPSVSEYRDDLEPDPKWDAPAARWRCKGCGHPLDVRDLVLEAGQDWAIRDHVLGLIDKKENTGDDD